eukprot:GFKZ01001913.1.p1 GENE.GFKZ01001913.1~~GFKZ01001913.1.p1  ORF type:complete len:564 (+),score=44.13 GFKZ01001913.1:656-2347(+)
MQLCCLPRDALDNVLSRLGVSDVLALARSSERLSSALSSYISEKHVAFNPQSKQHLLSPNGIGLHVRHLALQAPQSPSSIAKLGTACPNLLSVSFQGFSGTLPAPFLNQFLSAVGKSLRSFSAEFCAALAGPVILPALATHCLGLKDLTLRFVPHVYENHLDMLLASVGYQLLSLDLDSCVGVDDAVVATIAARCPLLTNLCVGATEDVGDYAVFALADSHCSKSIQRLDIRSCMNVTDDGLFGIATSFTNLRYLNVWRICLTSYAIRAVAEGLGETLETLVMGGSIGIDDTALQSIADNCDALVNLEMAGLDRITDAGVTALFDVKRTGRLKLETLTIDGCSSISEATVLAAAGLSRMPRSSRRTDNCGSVIAQEVTRICGIRHPMCKTHRANYCEDLGLMCVNCGSFKSKGVDDIQVANLETEQDSMGNCCISRRGQELLEPSENAPFLRRLAIRGTRKIRQALWNEIREARPTMDLRIDVATESQEEVCECRELHRRRKPRSNCNCGQSHDLLAEGDEYPCFDEMSAVSGIAPNSHFRMSHQIDSEVEQNGTKMRVEIGC